MIKLSVSGKQLVDDNAGIIAAVAGCIALWVYAYLLHVMPFPEHFVWWGIPMCVTLFLGAILAVAVIAELISILLIVIFK